MWLALGLIVAVIVVSSGALFLLTGIKNDFDARFDSLYRLVEENDSEAAAEAAEYPIGHILAYAAPRELA